MKNNFLLGLAICLIIPALAACNTDAPATKAHLTNPVESTESSNENLLKSFSTKNTVLDLVTTGTGLWATTSDGVIRWDMENGQQQTYTIQDGLGSNNVRQIICDSQGNIWITCYVDGVSRFNGSTWDNFTVENGLCSDDVITLAADQQGGVWVSAYWGVSYFDGQQWASYSNVSADEPVIGGTNPMKECRNLTQVEAELSAVDVIFVDSAGNVWFSNRHDGVTLYDGSKWKTFTENDGMGKGGVSAIFEDKDGTLWFGSSSGNITSFDGNNFESFTIDEYQSIIPRPYIKDILQDNRGNIWIAAYGGGVAMFDGSGWQTFLAEDGLPSNNTHSLFLDGNGYPGVITDAGVCLFNGSAWRIITAADGLPESEVRIVISDDSGNLWFGTGGDIIRSP